MRLRAQGLIDRLCHSKAAASGRGLPADDAAALLEAALFATAREADGKTAAAAASAFQYLLHVAQGSSAGPSPQVHLTNGIHISAALAAMGLDTSSTGKLHERSSHLLAKLK